MVRSKLAVGVLSVTVGACGLLVGLEDKSLLESTPDATVADGSGPTEGGPREDALVPVAPPQTVLTGLVRPTSVAVDVNNVYLTETSGFVKRLRKGEAQPAILAKNQPFPTQLLLDTQFVYWRNTNADKKAPGVFFDSMVRIDKTKDQSVSPQQITFEESTKVSDVRGIAIFEGTGENFIFYTREDKVRRKQRGDGQDTELANNQKIPTAIVADGEHVYFTVDGEYGIRRHTKSTVGPDGGPNPPVETMFVSPEARLTIALAVDDQSLYFITEAGTLFAMEKKPGSTPRVLAESAPTGGAAIALDGASVYWTNAARGTVNAVQKDGRADSKRVLAADRAAPAALAVDALDAPRRLYFVTSTELQRVDLP
ncbi:MAG: hypothetical protein JST00_17430 [Deltaproteobacteria bacterium]|nr:hypothetical protein [Deltaproteobacteria bacterium]